jgi:peptidoglycan hydrolase-like protein with peptidoglycan-binding domain
MSVRRLTLVTAALAAIALAPPARAAVNPQLAGLQVALRAYGLYLGPIDGIAGRRTATAVKAFQRRAGLPVDGLAGRRTRIALGPLGRPLFGTRTLHRGSFGWDVSVLQFLLHRRGLYRGPFDGYVGPDTVRALKRYQRALKLTADGVAGKATTAALVLQQRVPVRARPAAKPRYTVRPGDSLTAIAQRFDLGLATLVRANGLDPRKALPIGARLRIPASAASPAATAPARAAAKAQSVRDLLGAWAGRYGVDPSLARALSWMESGFQEDVRSSVGAWGPMQILPTTWDWVEDALIGKPVPKTTAGNVQVGLAYLRHLLDSFGGDERLALAGWYQGEHAVRERGLFDETKPFVANVLALKQRM